MLADIATELVEKGIVAVIALVVSALGSYVFGRWYARYLAQRAWQRRDFGGRVIVSLNIIRDGKLRIRSLLEKSMEAVFLNPAAVEMVEAAAQKTTVEDPILPIPKDDVWFLLNFVLNAVAEQFTPGLVRLDAGEPVKEVTYVICLTSEPAGDDRIRKVRALLVRRDLLVDFPYTDSMPDLEVPWHVDRVRTLRRMAERFRTHPEYFLTMNLCV